MENLRNRWNNLMGEVGYDHLMIEAEDVVQISWMIKEAKYILECYYEEGNSYYDLKEDDPKVWRSHVGKLSRMIKKLEGMNV